MKNLKFILPIIGITSGFSAYANLISNAKAAELSLHRVERLVILKKIEESFQSRPKSLSLVLLPHNNETEPVFKATLTQYPAADGTSKSLDILLNGEGKSLSQTVNSGGEASGFPEWTDKDPVTLAENSLHVILEGAPVKPELVPYNNGLTSFVITQGKNQAGEIFAIVDIRATETDPVLRVHMKNNGELDFYEFLKDVDKSWD